MKDSGYEQLVSNIRTEANNLESKDIPPDEIKILHMFADRIASGRYGINPK
jgi:hypothetical protein